MTPPTCPARFFRCCGEGTLRCELPPDHPGMHYATEMTSVGLAVSEW